MVKKTLNVIFNSLGKLSISALLVFALACQSNPDATAQSSAPAIPANSNVDTATVAGGCFWCVEASFEQITGVYEAVSGYAGGSAADADYKKVSYGLTNHTETVQVYYDPNVIDFATILDIFFTAHDPTQLNRQGPDVGRQYRSAIFYHTADQQKTAESKMKEWSPKFDDPIVTELNPYSEFYMAEEYHQNYERLHPYQPYIVNVSRPKIEKVKKEFSDRIKPEYQ